MFSSCLDINCTEFILTSRPRRQRFVSKHADARHARTSKARILGLRWGRIFRHHNICFSGLWFDIELATQ